MKNFLDNQWNLKHNQLWSCDQQEQKGILKSANDHSKYVDLI